MVEIPHLDKRVWLLLIAAGVGVGLYLRSRQSNATTDDSSGTPDMANVDGSVDDAYSSGDVTAIPGTQYGMPGPPGPPGPRGQRGKRGPRGKPPKKHHGNRHHKPAGSHAQPRIAAQSHMANNTPVASNVRVIQHRPGGVVAKGGRQSNG
jgi:hypothetical protein